MSSTAAEAVEVVVVAAFPAVAARLGADGTGRLTVARAASAAGPTEVPPGERGEAGEIAAGCSVATWRCNATPLGGKAKMGKVGGVGGEVDMPLKGPLAGSFGAAVRRASIGAPAISAQRFKESTWGVKLRKRVQARK